MDLPVIALDVDGALAPLTGVNKKPTEKALEEWGLLDNWQTPSGELGKDVWIASPVIEFFKKVSGNTATIMWNTSWLEMAQKIIEPEFGLPHWDLLATHEDYSNKEHWFKFAAVKKLLDQGRRIIWVDDEIDEKTFKNYFLNISISEYCESGQLLTINPDSAVGISKRHLSAIKNKLEEWKDL